MKDLFIIKNKYNDPRRGPFSASGTSDSQKKSNLIAMIPANALVLNKHQESSFHPRNNERYTADIIQDVTEFQVDEAPFIWRIDKHYGNYGTNCFISEDQEKMIKEKLGVDIKIERGVTSPGYMSGEYDRLIIPRSVSVLQATSLAYALRIAEVVYEDQLDRLHIETASEWEHEFSILRSGLEPIEDLSVTNRSFVEAVRDNLNLNEKDQLVLEYYFSKVEEESLVNFSQELAVLEETLASDFPSRKNLEDHTPNPEWFNRESSIHGTPHILRVMLGAELLTRLGQKDLPDYTINLKSLEVATMLHDVKRLKDSASDFKHGQRAAEFVDELQKTNPEVFEGADIDLVKRIMHYHSLDDYDGMTPEEAIFKDADALDRFRFNSGPDMRFIRTPMAEAILQSAYQMANLSKFLLSCGYTRSEAVLKAAEALRLIR